MERSGLALAEQLLALLGSESDDQVVKDYYAAFEASGGMQCAPTETSHTNDSAGHALTRNVEIADIAGFYRAFGVEVGDRSERPDHLAAELEFLQLLAVKEAIARGDVEGDGSHENVDVCLNATRAFLVDHVAQWVPRLSKTLAGLGIGPLYPAAGAFLCEFIAWDTDNHQVVS